MADAAHHTAAVAATVAATAAAAALHEEAVTVVDTVAEEADRHTVHTKGVTRHRHRHALYHQT